MSSNEYFPFQSKSLRTDHSWWVIYLHLFPPAQVILPYKTIFVSPTHNHDLLLLIFLSADSFFFKSLHFPAQLLNLSQKLLHKKSISFLQGSNMISLKALVDKGSNTVIFVESDKDFIDVLLSFLTVPMANVVVFAASKQLIVPVAIGCMNNLYLSVARMDAQHFQTEACKEMLLCPHSGAEFQSKKLKMKIDCDELTGYFLCESWQCTLENKLISHYKGVRCRCGRSMNFECTLTPSSSLEQDGDGIFVKESARFVVTDDLHVMSPSSVANNPLFRKLGVMNENTTHELTFNIGVNEALNLLIRSLVSKKPLSEVLLKQINPAPKLSYGNLNQLMICIESLMIGSCMKGKENICVKLTVSISKDIVCYAEAGEDFVNLLFSFLTIPLGFIVKHMRDDSFRGCIDQLYKCVEDLDPEKCLNSNYHKEILLSPKLYPGFCYQNRLLGLADGPLAAYYYAFWNEKGLRDILTTDKTIIHRNAVTVPLTLNDGKSPMGFLKGSTAFMVTDKLIIKPLSPSFGFSVLKELKVPLSDIKEETVHVGKKEALRLLVASFLSDSPLTDVFIRQMNQEKSIKTSWLCTAK